MKKKRLLLKRGYKKAVLVCVLSLMVATPCCAETTQSTSDGTYANNANVQLIEELTSRVNDENSKMNNKIRTLKKYNSKTRKVVDTYRNKNTKQLRRKTLKYINSSKKHYKKASAHLVSALKLAKQGKSVTKTISNARKEYKLSKKAAKKARSLSAKTKKRFIKTQTRSIYWNGSVLTKRKGVNNGPTGIETYYNLPMSGCVKMMRQKGYSEKKYPYWVRNDGCKMLGDYIMCGAYLKKYPKGTIVECSLGTCIVVDTGYMRNTNHLDIAVAW